MGISMIRCAFGLTDSGGMAQCTAGDAAWSRWRDHYAADFVSRGLSPSDLPFHEDGYLDAKHQERLLLGPIAGGDSNVDDKVEGEFTAGSSLLAASAIGSPLASLGCALFSLPTTLNTLVDLASLSTLSWPYPPNA